MKVTFAGVGWDDFQYWAETDRKVLKKLFGLIKECRRAPYTGIGKPEPLKGNLSGFWSRRITDEHRLVYRIHGEGLGQTLEIVQCRGHY